MCNVTLRLCLDVNVFAADLRGRKPRLRPAACSDPVSHAVTGGFPGGETQLIISAPMIEQWESVLQRHFGCKRSLASRMAWLFDDLARQGPLPFSTLLVVGSGFVQFASELEAEAAAKSSGLRADGNETGRMFDEIKDDRHVLLTAMAGKADILVTGNMREFRACRHVPRAGPKSPGAFLHRPKTGQGAHATSRRQCPAFRAGACRRTG